MTVALWAAVHELAERWRHLPPVRTVASALPRRGKPATAPIAKMLSDLNSRTRFRNPFRVGSEIPFLLSQDFLAHITRPTTYEAWQGTALEIDFAYREQIAWIRAQVPGYPLLRVPQLVQNTAFTTEEFTWRAVWPRSDMKLSFQGAQPPLTRIGTLQVDMRRELRQVSRALQASTAWMEFGAARASLTSADWQELTDTCQDLRVALSDDAIDSFEPTRAVRRDHYRSMKMEDALATLSARSSRYATAFTAAADHVDFAINDIMTRLAAFGPPADIGGAGNLDFIDADTVTFEPDIPFVDVGELVMISDPLVEEVGQVMGAHMSMHYGTFSQRIEVRLARGAAKGLGI